MPGNSRTVLFRRITFVMLPVITWEFLMQFVHVVITISFGKDRSSSYRKIFAISLYNSSMRYVGVLLETVSIDQQMLRTGFQPVYRPVHGEKRCIQDVYLINLFGRNNADGPGNRIPLNHFAQSISLLLRQLLGVIQQFILKIFR